MRMRQHKLYIRADAETKIGAGHVMRCLALAQVWKDHGGDVAFISRCDSDRMRQKIQAEGFALIGLPERCAESEDLETTLALLKNESIPGNDWLVLDGYHFTPEYQQAIRQSGTHLLVLDDNNHLPQYHADFILNPNMQAASHYYNTDRDTICLLGTRYVPLRREFSAKNRGSKDTPAIPRNVLITLGGSDPDNVTLKMITAFKRMDRPDLNARVILGPVNPHVTELAQEIGDDARIQLIQSPRDMAVQMAWADLAISAAGTTCWEQACLGIPTMVVILADNQRENAVALHEVGAAMNLGWHQNLSIEKIADALFHLMADPAQRSLMSRSGLALVDGRGAERVTQAMLDLTRGTIGTRLEIRPATLADAFSLWNLANDPVCRSNAFSPDPIPITEHLAWYRKKLGSPHTRIWILEVDARVSAQIRYDKIDDDTAEIDFSVMADCRGKGLGTKALALTSAPACTELKVRRLVGFVLESNLVSTRAFEGAGYRKFDKCLMKAGHSCLKYEYLQEGP